MLDARGVQCVRGDRTLFSSVDFSLQSGSLLRIAGANGSGKTSFLRIICGLSPPAEGEIRWRGEPIRALREEFWKELVYIGHLNAVKDDLTALENLRISCALNGAVIDDAAAVAALDQFGIARCAPLPARVLSQGQRRRVALSRLAISTGAALWVLDEPFTALDAAAVLFMQGLIAEHVARGGIVIFTTHQEVVIEAAVSLRVELGI